MPVLPPGGSGSGGGAKETPKRVPVREVENALVRLDALTKSGNVDKRQSERIGKIIAATGADLKSERAHRLLQQYTGADVPKELTKDRDAVSKVSDSGGRLIGSVLRQVSRPGQAVMSGIAEASRQGEADPFKVGPVPVRLRFGGEAATAAREGWNLQRTDTPLSISAEAGEERAKQGLSTNAFGVGGDLRTNPLGAPKPLRGAANVVFDVGGMVGTDPLTFVTLGTSGAAKAGLRTVSTGLGDDAARLVAQKGVSALDDAQRARLGGRLTPQMTKALEGGARGGLGVRVPSAAAVKEGRLLGPSHTVVPGSAIRAATAPAARLGRLAADTAPGRAAGRVLDAAGEVFVPRYGVRKAYGPQAAEALDDARVRYRGTLKAGIEDDVTALRAAIRSAGATTDELEQIVGPALDIGGNAVNVPDRLRPVVDAFAQVRDDLTDIQVEAGLLKRDELHRTNDYHPRVLTEAARTFVKGDELPDLAYLPDQARRSGLNDPFRKQRRLRPDDPISEINEALADEVGGDLFERNPGVAFTQRSQKARRAVATKEFLDDVAKVVDTDGNPLVRSVADLAIPPAQGWERLDTAIGAYDMPAAIAADVRGYVNLVTDPGTKGLVKFVDKWQTLWKSYATVPFIFGLGFHERNAYGNIFNNYLSGITSVEPYAKALRIQRKMSEGRKAGNVLTKLSPAERAIVTEARRFDVIGEGFFGVDLGDELRQASPGQRTSRLTKVNPVSTDNVVISSGRTLGSGIEMNARLAHFIAKLDELGSAAEAARSVRKYLFDYSDLTAAERGAFKRIHAFYTFTRKNTPLQLSALFTEPKKYARWQDVRAAVADEAPAPERLYSQYLYGMAATPTGARIGGEQVVVAPDLPGLSATETTEPVLNLLGEFPLLERFLPQHEEGLSGASRELVSNNVVGGAPGFVSSLAQVGTKRSFFNGAPIEGRDKQRLFLAEANLPVLPKARGLLSDDERRPRRLISAATGVNVFPQTERTERAEAYRRLERLKEEIAELKRQGIDVPPAPRLRRRRGL